MEIKNDGFLSSLNSALKCTHCAHSNCLISSLRGFRNGLYYGGKIRLIHSLVMEILFGKNKSLLGKLRHILKPTIEHALNLGFFALIYKTTVCILKRIFNSENKIINFIAGLVGSYFVWRAKTPVNTQIMLYLLSRNLMAIANMAKEKYFPELNYGFPIVSMLVWGVVMFLFEFQPKALQHSLKSSMDFIYRESDVYKDWRDFIPLYVPDWK